MNNHLVKATLLVNKKKTVRKLSFHDEADVRGIENNMPKIDSIGCPNSCLIKIEWHKYRTLVDTREEVSLIHQRV